MRAAVREWLAEAELDQEAIRDIVLACSEACANAVEHAVDPSEDAFELTGARSADAVALEVRDFGGWREPGPRDDRGLGLSLMRSLMTEVEVATGADGTIVRMRRAASAHVQG